MSAMNYNTNTQLPILAPPQQQNGGGVYGGNQIDYQNQNRNLNRGNQNNYQNQINYPNRNQDGGNQIDYQNRNLNRPNQQNYQNRNLDGGNQTNYPNGNFYRGNRNRNYNQNQNYNRRNTYYNQNYRQPYNGNNRGNSYDNNGYGFVSGPPQRRFNRNRRSSLSGSRQERRGPRQMRLNDFMPSQLRDISPNAPNLPQDFNLQNAGSTTNTRPTTPVDLYHNGLILLHKQYDEIILHNHSILMAVKMIQIKDKVMFKIISNHHSQLLQHHTDDEIVEIAKINIVIWQIIIIIIALPHLKKIYLQILNQTMATIIMILYQQPIIKINLNKLKIRRNNDFISNQIV